MTSRDGVVFSFKHDAGICCCTLRCCHACAADPKMNACISTSFALVVSNQWLESILLLLLLPLVAFFFLLGQFKKQ
jgi:hypothetical protein